MILAIDIGNTNIVVGGITEDRLHFLARVSTDRNKTPDEYTILLKNLLDIYNEQSSEIEGAIISSVVPPLTNVFKRAVFAFTGITSLIVGPGIKTGLNIHIDDPGQLGSDIVVTAVATMNKYPLPQIVIDMGTATTISVLDKKGTFLGCIISPGLGVSHDALVSRTSQLQKISLDAPESVIGSNTIESMKSGLVFGTSAMIDGLIERIEETIGEKATVIATGGMAGVLVPHCTRKDILLDNDLLVKGLYLIYRKNRPD